MSKRRYVDHLKRPRQIVLLVTAIILAIPLVVLLHNHPDNMPAVLDLSGFGVVLTVGGVIWGHLYICHLVLKSWWLNSREE